MGTKAWTNKKEVLSLNLCGSSIIDDNNTLIITFVGPKRALLIHHPTKSRLNGVKLLKFPMSSSYGLGYDLLFP